jgi:hypothetical protein
MRRSSRVDDENNADKLDMFEILDLTTESPPVFEKVENLE